ncbi:hypothetical protein MPSI1_002175 [Malassezia psittaci]|uniref:Uncharacterized protein n=1 Tax=Malassezia psittaci TaxID=1821823 RepID=A0AAF0JEB0_9BASI|nr:hypothetical protein MPSI1_002175 [Malassezia psittaci]
MLDSKELSEEQREILQRYAAGTFDENSVSQWPTLVDPIEAQIRRNVMNIPVNSTPVLHRAAPLAEWLREEAQQDEHPSEAARELLLEEHEILASDLQDFYPARQASPKSENWETRIENQALDQHISPIISSLKAFETSPPATVQRLAELVLEPNYKTRSKYLNALSRVVGVSMTLDAYDELDDQEAKDDQHDENWGDSTWSKTPASNSTEEPIYSPIPFLQTTAASDEPSNALKQHEEPLVLHGDKDAVYRVPDGRVDELDTADKQEQHGGVASHAEPLTAATSVPSNPDDTNVKRPRSDK